jgi:AhpC/TSA family
MTRLGYLALLALAGCMPMFYSGPGEGMKAPLTQGRDADGRTLSLSDYRGKVVLLSFWHGA